MPKDQPKLKRPPEKRGKQKSSGKKPTSFEKGTYNGIVASLDCGTLISTTSYIILLHMPPLLSLSHFNVFVPLPSLTSPYFSGIGVPDIYGPNVYILNLLKV